MFHIVLLEFTEKHHDIHAVTEGGTWVNEYVSKRAAGLVF